MKNIVTLLIIASLLLVPAETAHAHKATWDGKTGTIEADGIVVRFFQMTPHYLVWVPYDENETVVYHIQFVKIIEFNDVDGDNVVDDQEMLAKTELTAMDTWDVTASNETYDGVQALVVKFSANVTVFSVSKMGGAIGTAHVEFINKVFLDNYTTETGYEIAGGREIKIDVIISDWPWVSDDSKLALQIVFAIGDKEGHMNRSPQTHMHQVQVKNRAVRELRLNDTDVEYPLAFRWDEEIKVRLGDNETAGSVNCSLQTGASSSMLTLVYPHFNGTLEHDPSIVALETAGEAETGGETEETPLSTTIGGIPLIYILTVIGIIAVVVVVSIVRKK